MRIPLGYSRISAKGIRYVHEVLKSNRLSYGWFSRRLERLFASRHGSQYAVLSNSGTSALHVALAALKEKYRWPDGSEVLVPATTFIATSNVVIHNRLVPIFVDIEPDFFSIDPRLISAKIGRRTKAVIPVHLFGQPADMRPILEIAKKHRLRVIEDSAETMLAHYEGKSVGTFGDIGCFSTYMAHLLTTGVGGINTTNDPELAVMLRSLVNHGRDSIYLSIDDDKHVSGRKFKEIIHKRFSFVRLGHSFRLTEMESALGVAQLEENFERSIEKRRHHARRLTELLASVEDELKLPKVRPGSEHSFMMYPLLLKKSNKDKLVEYLEKKGVETRDLMPILNQPVYKKMFRLRTKDYPVSAWLVRSGFYVACHQDLSEAQLSYLAGTIRSFFKGQP